MTQDGGTRGNQCASRRKWITAAKNRARLRHAVVVCPNVTGRNKERIAQSKRARASSLAIIKVDSPQQVVARTCMLRAFFVLFAGGVILLPFLVVLFRLRIFAFIESAALCQSFLTIISHWTINTQSRDSNSDSLV